MVTGLVEGALILAFVVPKRYRRADEIGRPERSRRWVPVWSVLACVGLALAWWHQSAYMLIMLVLTLPMIAACVVDADVQRLPDALTLPMAAVLAVVLGVLAAVTSSWSAFGRSVAAAVVVFLVFLVLALVGGGGMGMGDVKLSLTVGLMSGYLSWIHVFLAVFMAALVGSVWGLGLRVVKGREAAREFAFGPHMVIGAQLVLILPALRGLWT